MVEFFNLTSIGILVDKYDKNVTLRVEISCRFPPSKYLVYAFQGAPGDYPSLQENHFIQNYIKFSKYVNKISDDFIKNELNGEKFVAIHLRNGGDMVSIFMLTSRILFVIIMAFSLKKSQLVKWPLTGMRLLWGWLKKVIFKAYNILRRKTFVICSKTLQNLAPPLVSSCSSSCRLINLYLDKYLRKSGTRHNW